MKTGDDLVDKSEVFHKKKEAFSVFISIDGEEISNILIKIQNSQVMGILRNVHEKFVRENRGKLVELRAFGEKRGTISLRGKIEKEETFPKGFSKGFSEAFSKGFSKDFPKDFPKEKEG